uniref:Retrovirus-related Pol polyprotein from transposon TNT 1-94 n=1 Tax=Cajanus cajan TaxID=3821 RepID=A0A151RN54_CAJCA|nr:Retrovirus-related Pol polyprotein from transposon TNT 1-94 [Cajanus cajan]
MIGSAKMQDMLYILRVPFYHKLQIKPTKFTHTINTVNFTASDLETLWHFRYTWIFLLKQKSETVKTLKNFVVFVQTQFETTIKIIRSDNGTEFFMTNFFVNKGIMHQTSCVNTPQQNSIAERKHGHLLNVARALMIQSQLPKIYWSYSVIHAAHIINMLPTPVLDNFSPHEMLYKTEANFNQLKVFGSLCYASTLSINRRKFDPRASKCVFLGFKRGTKGYVLLNIQSREIFVSRDVVFHEHVFPYQRVQDANNETDSPNIHDQSLFTEDQPILSQPS